MAATHPIDKFRSERDFGVQTAENPAIEVGGFDGWVSRWAEDVWTPSSHFESNFSMVWVAARGLPVRAGFNHELGRTYGGCF